MVATFLQVLYYTVPTLVGLYSFWLVSKKDGFDEEKTFDLLMFGVGGMIVVGFGASAVSTGQFSLRPEALNPYAGLTGFIGVCALTATTYKWSLYRVLDNLILSLVLAVAFWLGATFIQSQFKLGYAMAAGLLVVVRYVLYKYRPSLIRSGMQFSMIIGSFCIAAFILLPKNLNLIFIGLLFTLALLLLIFRLRSVYGKSDKVDRNSPNPF